MVLLWRADDGSADSILSFDSSQSRYVKKSLFVYVIVVIRGRTEWYKATDLFCDLIGDALEF